MMKHAALRAGLILALALGLAGCSGAPNPQAIAGKFIGPCGPVMSFANIAWSPDGEQIAFDTYVSDATRMMGFNTAEIGLMNPNGKDYQLLGDGSNYEFFGTWSPDGSQIVFTSQAPDSMSYDMFIMNSDGSGRTRLANNVLGSIEPTWLPDGKHIVFASLAFGTPMISIVSIDDADVTYLTSVFSLADSFDVSPDGQYVAFMLESPTDAYLTTEIYTLTIDSLALTRLTNNPAFDDFPIWSPDGMQIAFTSTREGSRQVYVMNADGTNPIRLTDLPGIGLNSIAWSPNGRQIIFAAAPNGDLDIYMVSIADARQIRLTNAQGIDADPAWSPDGKYIAFLSGRDGNPEIYRMDAGPATRATRSAYSGRSEEAQMRSKVSRAGLILALGLAGCSGPPGPQSVANRLIGPCVQSMIYSAPALSPDGTRFAVVAAESNAGSEIYLMNVNGSRATLLADTPGYYDSPAWSPDGKQIAFAYSPGSGSAIDVIDLATSARTRLADVSGNNSMPTWSPGPGPAGDGKRIAFTSWRDGNPEIYVMDADGSNQTRLTYSPEADDTWPAWSPGPGPAGDGKRIAFMSARDASPDIYILDVDSGSNETRLRDSPTYDAYPSWSPDGTQIAFASLDNGEFQIYVINIDPETGAGGSNLTQLTSTPGGNAYPSWSADGQHLIFVSGRKGFPEIYLMDVDGSNPTQLTNNPANQKCLQWPF